MERNTIKNNKLPSYVNKHKYLSEIGVPITDIPLYFNADKNDPRESRWEEQRKTYGFDDRETWALCDLFFMWFYERLMMFNTFNNIDTNNESEFVFINDTEKISLQQGIDELIELCKYFILFEYNAYNEDFYKKQEEWHKHYERFILVFQKILPKLWW